MFLIGEFFTVWSDSQNLLFTVEPLLGSCILPEHIKNVSAVPCVSGYQLSTKSLLLTGDNLVKLETNWLRKEVPPDFLCIFVPILSYWNHWRQIPYLYVNL